MPLQEIHFWKDISLTHFCKGSQQDPKCNFIGDLHIFVINCKNMQSLISHWPCIIKWIWFIRAGEIAVGFHIRSSKRTFHGWQQQQPAKNPWMQKCSNSHDEKNDVVVVYMKTPQCAGTEVRSWALQIVWAEDVQCSTPKLIFFVRCWIETNFNRFFCWLQSRHSFQPSLSFHLGRNKCSFMFNVFSFALATPWNTVRYSPSFKDTRRHTALLHRSFSCTLCSKLTWAYWSSSYVNMVLETSSGH